MTKNTVKNLGIALSFIPVFIPFKALADDYNQLFIFGDSLSDNGNLFKLTGGIFPLSPPYFQGRFSNGPVWVEILGYDLKIDTNVTNNFAIGGSTSGNTNALSETLKIPLPSLPDQLDNFNSIPGTPSPDALFILWAGANDYLIKPTEQRATDTQVVVNNLSNAVRTLINKGARNIIVPNLPDLGKTPQERSQDTASSITTLTNSHNNNLNLALQQIAKNRNVNIIPLDVNALFNEILAEPAKYGYTNVTDRCFNQAVGTLCSNPDQYLFWDGIHPTARGHQLIAEYTVAVLNAPEDIIPQADVALNVAKRQVQLIDAHLVALRNTSEKPPANRLSVFLKGDANFGNKDSTNQDPGYDSTNSGVAAGFDYHITNQLAVGTALGFASNDTEVGKNKGDIEVNGYAVSVYSNYVQKGFYSNAALTYGGNDFDIKRKITFNNRRAMANTEGTQFSVNLNGGYIARSGSVSYGPTLGLRYDRVSIDGYTEKEAGSLNMKVDEQQAESCILSVGAQVAVALKTGIGTVIPNIRASYEHQLAENRRTITTELVTQPGIPMRVKTNDSDRDYFKLGAGAQVVFSENFAGAIDYETAIGLENFSDNTIKGEIRYQF
ncbi:MAG: autotransporter domain-containing protein [Chlorogloeopsis fritschii C42_A2020_084]|uniref:autotransporter domain-containing protein n=1 Tax=Chlorogloeopsis fritschii TaxID=1124 RepID=UPI0019F158D6|nr:autotransporter domain-containing protein [Chlorogloeopsis fritschii]MBF2005152.1 autotransporter domain-containing protein [Chlorogloeopsis fritschii C42_A2020_084]